MAIAACSSAPNDRALCTSIALTRYDELTCRSFHGAAQVKPAVTVVHRSRLAHYFVMLSGFKTRPSAAARRISASCCAMPVLDLHTHPGDGARTTALSERAYKFCRTRIARGKW